jgi:hypothetical protein
VSKNGTRRYLTIVGLIVAAIPGGMGFLNYLVDSLWFLAETNCSPGIYPLTSALSALLIRNKQP